MKLDNKILISIIIIGLLIFIFLLYKELTPYREEALLTRTPFTEIKILNQKVEINNTNKLYKHNIDCTNLKVNEQIISYKLVEEKENYKVSTTIKVFKDNKILKDNYKDATNIETHISIKDKNELYEQIYIIESTCQQGEIS